VTNLAKAIASATRCPKWTAVSTVENMRGTLVCDGRPGSILSFNLDSAQDLEAVLREFLGKRHVVKINCGKTGLFQWRMLIGLQELTPRGVCVDHARADGEELWDAILDACVQAAGMFEKP
jgi:hypothetical protein